jgi:hypothetical protein
MSEEINTLKRKLFGAAALGLVAVQLGAAAPSFAQAIPAANDSASVNRPLSVGPRAPTEDESIRAFRINVPEEQLVDLRKRIAATRWPDKETVNDASQGIRLAEMQALVHYWGTD